MLCIYYMLQSILLSAFLRNDCFIIIFIECFQLMVIHKINVCGRLRV